MKVILSRKGFDSGAGGCASPIIDDTMLSLPIPSDDDVKFCDYEKLSFGTDTYLSIAKALKTDFNKHGCHLDPDIRRGIRNEPKGWRPAFGQTGAAQTELENAGVVRGDLFLFFGWFRKANKESGQFAYLQPKDGGSNLQAIYGYMQIGEIIKDKGAIQRDYPWHPHSLEERFWQHYQSGKNEGKRKQKKGRDIPSSNTLYVPADSLALGDQELDSLELPGSGTFKFDERVVLTKDGESRTKWDYEKLPEVFGTARDASASVKFSITHHPSPFEQNYFQSADRGQEFVMSENKSVTQWVIDLIKYMAAQDKIES